jgi:hypothetical protein
LGQAHQEHTRNRPGRKPAANLAGEAFWVGFGIITGVLALVAGTRFLTHLLPPDEYGKLALAVSLSTLAVMIFGDPVGKTAVRSILCGTRRENLTGSCRTWADPCSGPQG